MNKVYIEDVEVELDSPFWERRLAKLLWENHEVVSEAQYYKIINDIADFYYEKGCVDTEKATKNP